MNNTEMEQDIVCKQNVGEQPTSCDEKPQDDGSLLDKFKSVDALKSAYQNLEKEFTQKCQELSRANEKLSLAENAVAPEKPIADKQFEEFLSKNSVAKKYVQEMSEILKDDKTENRDETFFENTLEKAIAQKNMPYNKIVDDQNFLNEYIFSNSKIKEHFIDDYLKDISAKKTLPLMTSTNGIGTTVAPVSKPKTIGEAGKVAESYFKD